MSESQLRLPEAAARDEARPGVDVDSGTDEDITAKRVTDPTSLEEMKFAIWGKKQRRHLSTPDPLHAKAERHQHRLTEEERQLLLDRDGLVGKALGYPESLTITEIHRILCWPPPEIIRDNILAVTGGKLSTPSELYAKAKDALDRDQLGEMLNKEEIELLANNFHATKNNASKMMAVLFIPGAGLAMKLLHSRMGLDFAVPQECHTHVIKLWLPLAMMRERPGFTIVQPPRRLGLQEKKNIMDKMWFYHYQLEMGYLPAKVLAVRLEKLQTALLDDERPTYVRNHLPPPRSDLFGLAKWPPKALALGPMLLFRRDAKVSGFYIEQGWWELSEDEREAYRARAETLRLEAWVEYETAVADETTLPFHYNTTFEEATKWQKETSQFLNND